MDNLNPCLLMWDMRRGLNITLLPPRRVTVQFIYPELTTALGNLWLLIDPKTGVDLCSVDPGFDVDLFCRCSLRTMTAIWMGLDKVSMALADDRLSLLGDKGIATNMQAWLGLSPFAVQEKQVN